MKIRNVIVLWLVPLTLFAAVSGTVKVSLDITHTKTGELSSPTETITDSANYPVWTITDGTAVNQANKIWHDRRTLAGSATETLALTNVLTDTYGTTMQFTAVKMFLFKSPSTNDNSWTIGNAAANGWSFFGATNQTLTVRQGGTLLLLAPDATAYAVGGTSFNLKVANTSTNAQTYEIYLMGK